MKILVVEDEKPLSDALSHILKNNGFIVFQAFDGKTGLLEALTNLYDLIILDVMLPLLDGFSILKEVRKENISTPVLMLTARADLDSRVTGLNSGADYYLSKPFETEELLACINVLLRRKNTSLVSINPSFGDLTLDINKSELQCSSSQKTIKLSLKENTLCQMLINSNGRAVTKEQIISKLWGFENDSEYNNTEVYVSFLRRKFKYLSSKVGIKSIRGSGYYLEEEND